MVPVDPAQARAVIAQVERWQHRFMERLGSRFAWLSDEWYLIAGLPLPPRDAYEDLPQQENGVGSIRAFLEALEQASLELPELGQSLAEPGAEGALLGRLLQVFGALPLLVGGEIHDEEGEEAEWVVTSEGFDNAHIDGNLVTARTWHDNAPFMREFMKMLKASIA